MFRTIRGVLLLGIAAMALSGSSPAQKAAERAPVPAQIFSAKKVFVSNAPGDDSYGSGPARLYDPFYAALKSWGRYELVSDPRDADLVFELTYLEPIVDVTVTGTAATGASGGSHSDPQVRLVILDPKTHVSLWWFAAHIKSPFLRLNR